MPAIATLNLTTAFSGGIDVALAPLIAESNSAKWVQNTFPELARVTAVNTIGKADPRSGLVKSSFRVTFPTLKSAVTDPSGPYAPPPALDYVTVAELSVWTHPRSTAAERERAISSVCIQAATGNLASAALSVASGYPYY